MSYSKAQFVLRLRGGGGDGGSTGAESRDCYLEMYKGKKQDKVDPALSRYVKWTTCKLSGETLQAPCVSDYLGNIFNKESIIKALLSKSMPEKLKHISSIKHLINLKLQVNPNFDKKQDGKSLEAPFQCPVTDLPFNGLYKFYIHKNSGWVLCEKAIKEIPLAVEDQIGQQIKMDDFIQVNMPQEQYDESRVKLIISNSNGKSKKRPQKSDDQNLLQVKKQHIEQQLPKGATQKVYDSLFIKNADPKKYANTNDFLSRNLAARGMNLT